MVQGREDKGEKKWDNCNSIINNIEIFISKSYEFLSDIGKENSNF